MPKEAIWYVLVVRFLEVEIIDNQINRVGEKLDFENLKNAFLQVFEYISEDFADEYLDNFFADKYNLDEIDFSKLISFHNDLVPAKMLEATMINSKSILIKWDFDANASPNDLANIVILNSENGKLIFRTRCGTRDTEKIKMVLNYRVKDAANLHAWIFFNVFNTKVFSDWKYFNIK